MARKRTPGMTPGLEAGLRVLDLPMDDNDSGARTVRGYLTALLETLWREEDSFSGKKPFGNGGWKHDLYLPMIRAGMIRGSLDKYGYITDCDDKAGNRMVLTAIAILGQPPAA